MRTASDATDAILGMDRFNNLIWPNLNINAQYQQIRIVQPVAPDRTIVQAMCFRLGGAPEGIFHRAVRFLTNLSSPASMIFADDVEIFEKVQAGLVGREPGMARPVARSRRAGRQRPPRFARHERTADPRPVPHLARSHDGGIVTNGIRRPVRRSKPSSTAKPGCSMSGRFEDWLALFDEDGLYWIPGLPGQTDRFGAVSIVHEDRTVLRMRVRRISHPRAWSLMPLPRSSHLLGNIDMPSYRRRTAIDRGGCVTPGCPLPRRRPDTLRRSPDRAAEARMAARFQNRAQAHRPGSTATASRA